MDETALQLYRRQRLDEAIAHLTAGNVTAFGRLLGYRDGAFVRQMLSGSRAVSDKTVRAIETLRGMRAWFQSEGGPPLQAGEQDTAYPAGQAGTGGDAVLVLEVRRQQDLGGGRQGPESACTADAGMRTVALTHEWLERRSLRARDLIAVAVSDDSMQPSLHPGDVVAVDTHEPSPADGQVFVVDYEGACLVRRVVRDSGAWWLAAENALRFPRKQLTTPSARLVGRVVHVHSETL
ncbi:S24 family peptidase [Paracidovorax cattleyae]|uniref:Peptidase S24-like n=1 Tax=Paracidovorax cattleyae TaxID=80868 RepID=A0A1H0UR48_9BURK|nr:S24 family peptidase [Paracidovorax cattleyae]AVS75946.1 peptidase [Paracidovorax cattleyae]MBF9264148.1 S24 family peptidase [Paracidovorax cattleyae]SDP68573.1 Peptidase S24-like [Paracidovorax cattleyae]